MIAAQNVIQVMEQITCVATYANFGRFETSARIIR
jgi:hypothetical protein